MWSPMTGRFGPQELRAMETTPAANLLGLLMRSDPLVILRALAEVMLNGDEVKLAALLSNQALNDKWQQGYASDREVDGNDHDWAGRLRARCVALR